MKFRDFLKAESIRIRPTVSTKQEVIQNLVDVLAGSYKLLNREELLNAVLEREALMSTGVGKGVAIPHGKADSVSDVIGSLAVLEPGVDFGAPDGIPAQIIILLMASAKETGPHIRALAHISRVLQDDKVREGLIKTKSPKEIFEILDQKEEEL